MTCLRSILKDESQTVGNNPLRCSSPTLNPTYLPIFLALKDLDSFLHFIGRVLYTIFNSRPNLCMIVGSERILYRLEISMHPIVTK